MSSSGISGKWVMIAVAVLLCGGAVAVFLIPGGDGDPPAEPKIKGSIMEAASGEDARRLQAVKKKMERFRHVMHKQQAEAEERLQTAGESKLNLEPREKSALKAAVGGCYDPRAIQRALDEKRTSQYASEVIEKCNGIRRAQTLDTPTGPVPMTKEMKEVVKRSSWLKNYALTLIKTQKPSEQEDEQWKELKQINDKFEYKLQSVSDLFPFLEIEMMEIP